MHRSSSYLARVVIAGLIAGGMSFPEAALAAKASKAPRSADPLPRRAFLGTQVAPLSAETRARQKLADSSGVEIVRVIPGSSAEAAKLRAGDVVVSIDRTPVGRPQDFVRTVGSKKGKPAIELVLWRDGSRRTQRVPLRPMPREESPDYEVEYASVESSGGRLRLLWTRPRGEAARRPALFLIQGVGTFSVENVPATTGGYAAIIDDFTRRGYVTLRVDKPGCGDSEGGPLQDVDFDTQLDGFRQALRTLRSDPRVDPDRILIFGHSMGGVWGPLLATEMPVHGIAVYGTLSRTWLEYLLENDRRQTALAGISPGAVDSSVAILADAHYWMSRKGLTPDQAIEKDPSLEAWVDSTLTQGTYFAGLHYRFLHQISAKSLGAAWSAFPGHALALWGRGDFVSSEADHRLIASLVNQSNPGRGEFRVLETSDHGFYRSASERESWERQGRPGEFNPEIVAVLKEWSDRIASPSVN
ncbi:MAG TPA: alpha/beta fold hydrolase [Candidatus Eisenbacteria bacterium]|nr:alpha/beta fold hydrolase [Candidatus Eisenbacteria bacterium]